MARDPRQEPRRCDPPGAIGRAWMGSTSRETTTFNMFGGSSCEKRKKQTTVCAYKLWRDEVEQWSHHVKCCNVEVCKNGPPRSPLVSRFR